MDTQFIKILFGIVFLICTAEDIRKKRVHLMLLMIMGVIAALDCALDQEVALWMRAAGMLAGSIFLLMSRVTHQQIGTGDGILLIIAGGYLGIFSFIEFVMYAFFIAALAAIVLLCIRKMDRKRKMPLIPFLFAGFLLCEWIGG